MFGLKYPQSLLQPWQSLQQFSEELYAMFSQDAPPEPQDAQGDDPWKEVASGLQAGRPASKALGQPGMQRARPVPTPAMLADQIAAAPLAVPTRETFLPPAYEPVAQRGSTDFPVITTAVPVQTNVTVVMPNPPPSNLVELQVPTLPATADMSPWRPPDLLSVGEPAATNSIVVQQTQVEHAPSQAPSANLAGQAPSPIPHSSEASTFRSAPNYASMPSMAPIHAGPAFDLGSPYSAGDTPGFDSLPSVDAYSPVDLGVSEKGRRPQKPDAGTTDWRGRRAKYKYKAIEDTDTAFPPPYIGGEDGGSPIFLGKVVSGGPGKGPYLVQLFSLGPDEPPDLLGPNSEPGGRINVSCLQLDDKEKLPADMWLYPIWEIDIPIDDNNTKVTYWAQPPVWQA